MKTKSILLILICLFISTQFYGQRFGSTISLDGKDDYLVVPHHESLNPSSGSWTVAFWIKAVNKDQVAPIVMKRLPESPYTQYSYAFGKDDPHDPEPGKKIRVNHIASAGVSERSGHTNVEVIDGEWHHIVVVADKLRNGIIIYVDGNSLKYMPLYHFGAWPDVKTDTDLIIASGSSGAKIEGPLDELSIWNRALDANSIQKIMHDTLSPEYYTTADSGLVAYYRFDKYENLGVNGGGLDDFRDLSINKNHADAEGKPQLIPSGVLAGIDVLENSDQITIYPNPAREKIRVEGFGFRNQKCKIELFDLNGKRMEGMLEEASNSNALEIDVSHLRTGIYLCRIEVDENFFTKKIIIR